MDILSDYELEVLKRFLNGDRIRTKKEERILERYRKEGWVTFKIEKPEVINGKVRVAERAILTSQGKFFTLQELIKKSWWKRFFIT